VEFKAKGERERNAKTVSLRNETAAAAAAA